MPKITLLNNETGKTQDFEPVDAREVLSMEGTIYSVPQETKDAIGQRLDSNVHKDSDGNDVNIPQLNGGDAEMQTGNSADKYGREQVVIAQPGSVQPSATADKPMTTTGKPLESASTAMTVPELKAALDAKKIDYPTDAKKVDLQALYDASNGK